MVEVPCEADAEDWGPSSGMDVTWLPRDSGNHRPGERALAALRAGPPPHREAYAFVAGESTLATSGRRWLVGAGLTKERIFFSGYDKRPSLRSRLHAARGSRRGEA